MAKEETQADRRERYVGDGGEFMLDKNEEQIQKEQEAEKDSNK